MSKNLNIKLKADQLNAFDELKKFIHDAESRVFILKGYAGTGKTTMMRVFIEELEARGIIYCLLASTGRASKILSNYTHQPTSTVHGRIYTYKGLNQDLDKMIECKKTEIDDTGQLLLNFGLCEAMYDDKIEKTPHFYIIDESSMISDVADKHVTQAQFGSGCLLTDLLKYDPKGKFVFVGDVCQLPPIQQSSSPALSETYFKEKFHISAIDYELTEIVRQKGDNDLIDASKKIRELYYENPAVKWLKFPLRGYDSIHIYSDQASFLRSYINQIKGHTYKDATLISSSNKNCLTITNLIRPALNFNTQRIQTGDLLLVTQNNYPTGLMNGDMVEIIQIGTRERRASLTFVQVQVKELFTKKDYSLLMIEDIVYGNQTNITQKQQKELFIDFYLRMKNSGIKQNDDVFQDEMRKDVYLNALRAVFGYVLTCHKSQGGEWDDVYLDIQKSILFYERPAVYQWLYTAMTRARKRLHIVDNWWIE